MLYLDTSALAKLYVLEAGTASVRSLVQNNENELFASFIAYAEILSVLARCLREKRISQAHYRSQKQTFLQDWSAVHVIGVTADVLAPLPRLIERHVLRASDAIHLCSALWIGRPLFGCFDERLRRAAETEGLVAVP